MKNTLLAVIALMLAAPTQTVAQDSATMTGAEFLSACSRADPEWIGFCHGYVQAVFDGIERPGEDVCAPAGLTRAKIVGAVVLELTENPRLREFSAASVVYAVLKQTFPCR